jgi:hypothetical protein
LTVVAATAAALIPAWERKRRRFITNPSCIEMPR